MYGYHVMNLQANLKVVRWMVQLAIGGPTSKKGGPTSNPRYIGLTVTFWFYHAINGKSRSNRNIEPKYPNHCFSWFLILPESPVTNVAIASSLTSRLVHCLFMIESATNTAHWSLGEGNLIHETLWRVCWWFSTLS